MTSSDGGVTCLPNNWLRKAQRDIERGKSYKKDLADAIARENNLTQILSEKDSLLSKLQVADNQKFVELSAANLTIALSQNELNQARKDVLALKKYKKRGRQKQFVSYIASALVAILPLILKQ